MGIFASLQHPWKGKMEQASFRGEKFYVRSHNTEVGRKQAAHEFPLQNDPWYEDLGRKGRKIKVEAYVIQSGKNRYDYMKDRDNLLAALEEKGPGTLIHPWAKNYFGNLDVVVESAEFSEQLDEGGICRFSITFATTQEESPLIEGTAPPAFEKLSDMVSDALGATLDALDAASEAVKLDVAQAWMRTISSSLNQIKGATAGTLGAATGYVSGLLANLANVINTPCDLAASLLGAANAAKGIVGLGEETVTGGVLGGCSGVMRNQVIMDGSSVPRELGRSCALNLINGTYFNTDDALDGATPPLPVVGTGETADQSRLAQEAIQHAGASLLLGSLSEIAIAVEYNSQDDARDMAERLSSAYEDQLTRLGAASWSGADDVYQQLEETRNRVIARMREIGAGLPMELDYIPPGGAIETTLVLAYRKYKNLDMAEDVELRNRPTLRHPGFLPAATLRILAEATP